MPPRKQQKGKEIPRKRQRGEGSSRGSDPEEMTPLQRMLHFTAPAHMEHFSTIQEKKFIPSRFIDWPMLEELGLANEVRQLISFGGWDVLFDIREPAYYELTMEFLSTLAVDDRSRDMHAPTLEFRVNGERYKISYTQFALYMGLVTQEYVASEEYNQLPITFSVNFRIQQYYRTIGTGSIYDPTKTKGSTLRFPALRYVHKLLAHTISARGDSTGVISQADLFYIHSMHQRSPIQLGFCLARFIWSQAKRPRAPAILCGSYITRLIRGMHLLHTLPQGMTVKCQMLPITIVTLRQMGMVRLIHRADGTTRFVLADAVVEEEQPPPAHPAPPVVPHPEAAQAAGPSSQPQPSTHDLLMQIIQNQANQEAAMSELETTVTSRLTHLEDLTERLCNFLGISTFSPPFHHGSASGTTPPGDTSPPHDADAPPSGED